MTILSAAHRLARAGIALLTLSAFFCASSARADEGMWTFDHFPSATVKARYGSAPDAAWLAHVRAAAVRLTSGCSASVVSADGLVMTNHHCVVDCVQANSTPDHDLVADGVRTHARSEEKLCPGMQAEILTDISDVTARIQEAMKASDAAGVVKARDGAIAQLEATGCRADASSRCQVVSLYHGGQYRLYRYRKYNDVRLVFAPEFSVAFFGGDPDNFNFPRFNLDSAFVRLYENGQPAATPEHLHWRRSAPKEGELVYVAGNPGSTDRLLTVAQLAQQRDWQLPVTQAMRSELRGRLIQYAASGPEPQRVSADLLFGLENSYKAFYGRERTLLDPAFFASKVRAEQTLRAKVAASAPLRRRIGDPWREIEAAMQRYQPFFLSHLLLEQRAGSASDLYQYARELVRAAQERPLPNAQRLREYADSRLPLLEKELLDPRPVYPDLERIALEFWLLKCREFLTADSAPVRELLGAQSPEALAAALVGGTHLGDPKVREALWRGGQAAIEASDDPLIRFVRAHDATARAVRARYEEQVVGPVARASERIANAQFAVYGDTTYPDATFTLRLSYGAVRGWQERGEAVPPWTTIGGLYQRASGAAPYRLPTRWLEAKDRLDPSLPFDVATTNDIIGGNSGSPLIDAQGNALGAIFDGNIHSLGGDYGYDGADNRAVAVLTVAIGAALREVYQMPALAAELEGP